MSEGRKGRPRTAASPPTRSFGDQAAEMANETEVEEPVTPRHPARTETPETQDPDVEGTDETADEAAADDAATEAAAGPDEPTTDGVEPSPEEPDAQQLAQALAERTADLQRLQAEYVNYKRRVDRDRELVRENATYAALAPIVEVLDTIDRARDSAQSRGDELDEGFSTVAEQLERVVTKAGLTKYGEVGDAFDPRLHEALSHIGEDPDVEVTTCKVIAKAGYRIGERVVRAAQVLVVDPASG